METRSINAVLKTIFAALFILCTIKAAGVFFLSPDSYFHAASGREILRLAEIPKTDPFSFGRAGKWDASSWLFDSLYYLSIYNAGIDASLFIKIAAVLAVFGALFIIIYKRLQGKYLTAVFPFVLAGAWLIAQGAAVTPALASVIFTVYFFNVLERKPSKRNRLLYFSLPPAALMWSNMSELSLIALPLMLIYILYRGINRSELPEKTENYDFRLFLISAALVIPALFLNPGLVSGVKNFVMGFKTDWLSGYDAVSSGGQVYAAVTVFYSVLLGIVLFLNARGADVGRHAELIKDMLVTALFAALALKDSANVPLFAAATIPIMAYYVFLIFRWGFVWPRQWTERDWQNIKKSFYLLLIPALALYLYAPSMAAPQKNLPSQAVSYISNVKVPRALFTGSEISSYVIYSLYPTYKAMVSPASSDAGLFADYESINSAKPGFEAAVEKYGIASFLLKKGEPLVNALDTGKYAPAYFDDNWVIYTEKEKSERYFSHINPAVDDIFYMHDSRAEAEAELKQFTDSYPSQRAHLLYARLKADEDRNAAIDYLQYTVESFADNSKLYALLGKLLYEAGDYENAADALSKTREKSAEIERFLKDARQKVRIGG